jgi:centrin-1
MSKKSVPPKNNNKPVPPPVKKEWKLEDYVTATVLPEEVKDVKIAFDIFDTDGSGFVDAQELKHAFVQLGFGTTNKFAYNILHDLDTEDSKGISFEEFLKLATSKLSDKHSRAEIEKVFKQFDTHKTVIVI